MLFDSDSRRWLKDLFGSSVKFDEPMSRHTSLRVGGPAEAYVMPESQEELTKLVDWLWQKRLPYLIVGDGTNLLVKDNGIDGIVIVLTKCLKKITKTAAGSDGITVTAMAGVRLQALCSFAIEHGLEGMNFALGIPGTVGGGIAMNAGASYGSMEDVLSSIRVLLPTGQIERIERKRLNFGYRRLSWKKEKDEAYQGQPVVLEGSFCLHPSDPQRLRKEAGEILKGRKKRQPAASLSAGCFFKNPPSGKTAGELIDLAGLKGKSIGEAEISPKHANFIINRGRASAADILALMEYVQKNIKRMFGIDLEAEIKIVGR